MAYIEPDKRSITIKGTTTNGETVSKKYNNIITDDLTIESVQSAFANALQAINGLTTDNIVINNTVITDETYWENFAEQKVK